MLSNKLVVIHNHEVPSSILGPATEKIRYLVYRVSDFFVYHESSFSACVDIVFLIVSGWYISYGKRRVTSSFSHFLPFALNLSSLTSS